MDPNKFVDHRFGGPARRPGDKWAFDYFLPELLPRAMTLDESTVMALSEADNALGHLNGLGRLLTAPEILIRPFLTREALDSSKIEGTKASLSEVLQAEVIPEDSSRTDDVREVARYLAATRQGLELVKTLPITQRLIRMLHETLMTGVRGQEKQPGELRTTPVWVGSPGATPETASYVPPLPEHLPELLDDWERFVNDPPPLPTLVRAALMHYQFETIHPFLDGNGRIGRLLIGLQLQSEQRLARPLLYLSGYFELHREAYYAHLQAVRETAAIQAYLQFFLSAVREQANDAVGRTGHLVELRARYESDVRMERSRVGALIPLVLSSPFLTANRVRESVGVTNQGARNLLLRAQEQGWIEQIGTAGRGGMAVWRATEVLRVIEAPLSYLNSESGTSR